PERGELERLREVTERQPVWSELLLERRPEDARLDARGSRRTVDFEHAVEPRKVDGHRARVAIADDGLDAAHDARAAAVRYRGRAHPGAPVENRGDLVLRARVGDDVRGMREVAAKAADDVTERFPVGVRRPVERRAGAELGESARRRQARGRE